MNSQIHTINRHPPAKSALQALGLDRVSSMTRLPNDVRRRRFTRLQAGACTFRAHEWRTVARYLAA